MNQKVFEGFIGLVFGVLNVNYYWWETLGRQTNQNRWLICFWITETLTHRNRKKHCALCRLQPRPFPCIPDAFIQLSMSISTWVSSRHLKLNMPQIELPIFSPKNCTIVSISCPDTSILPVARDKISEASLSSLGIQALIKSCWLCSQNTFRTQPLDSASTFSILFWDIVNSCLDPSNSLLTGFPASFLSSSQFSTQQTERAFKNISRIMSCLCSKFCSGTLFHSK